MKIFTFSLWNKFYNVIVIYSNSTIQKGFHMSLNKHKIIPLIESYYHTFTPLERTIADFFIHNTEEQDFSSRNISGLLYVSEASLSRFAQKCGFHGYREFIYEYKQSWHQVPKKIFRILKYRNLILIRNFWINLTLCWTKRRSHGSQICWFPNLVFMFTEEAVPVS